MRKAWIAPRDAALIALAGCTLAACDGGQPSPSASASAGRAYVVPRTAWGDPDLQGKWPSTAMVGVPVQRDEKLGARDVLNDEEFAAREAAAARLTEQDNADFNLENAASTPGGGVGGPVS